MLGYIVQNMFQRFVLQDIVYIVRSILTRFFFAYIPYFSRWCQFENFLMYHLVVGIMMRGVVRLPPLTLTI